MDINQLEQFEGLSILCPIASTMETSNLKRVQAKANALYLDDEDEDEDSGLPKIASHVGSRIYLNQEQRPELQIDLMDDNGMPFSLYVTYISERHTLDSYLEAPSAS